MKTVKQQIKAELKQYVKVKFVQLTDTVASLTRKVVDLTKQNKDLKSQVGDIRKNNNNNNNKKQHSLCRED